VILDNQIYSAPIIRDRISRQGVITGRFTSQEAADLAVILRAGALPIPVVLEEERTIGPALGADSISRGLRASALAAILVVAFMVLYYRVSGVYASVAMAVNLVLIVGLMSVFEGTLTLPVCRLRASSPSASPSALGTLSRQDAGKALPQCQQPEQDEQ
jgi:preprotein translocase subunit SecD